MTFKINSDLARQKERVDAELARVEMLTAVASALPDIDMSHDRPLSLRLDTYPGSAYRVTATSEDRHTPWTAENYMRSKRPLSLAMFNTSPMPLRDAPDGVREIFPFWWTKKQNTVEVNWLWDIEGIVVRVSVDLGSWGVPTYPKTWQDDVNLNRGTIGADLNYLNPFRYFQFVGGSRTYFIVGSAPLNPFGAFSTLYSTNRISRRERGIKDDE